MGRVTTQQQIGGQFDRVLVDPLTLKDPNPVYVRLRDEVPVVWSSSLGVWMVSRYDDVTRVLHDHDTFSSVGFDRRVLDRIQAAVSEAFPYASWEAVRRTINSMDPPDHTRIRERFTPAFARDAVRQLAPRIRQHAGDLLDRARDCDTIDLVKDYSLPLSRLVIADMILIPEADRAQFYQWCDRVHAGFNNVQVGAEGAERVEHGVSALGECGVYFASLIDERRDAGGTDVLSLLSMPGADGAMLDDGEVIASSLVALTGGPSTANALLGNLLFALLTHPEQLARVRSSPEHIPAAIEEALRWESPFKRVRRVAARDTDLAGTAISKEDPVVALLGSANRDPRFVEDPDRFDITRRPVRHVAFGGGIHHCPAPGLSRLQTRIAVEELLRRTTDLTLVDGADTSDWTPSLFVRRLRSLPARLRCVPDERSRSCATS